MIIHKKHSDLEVNEICIDLTRTYLNSIELVVVDKNDLSKFRGSSFVIAEGYRHALCVLLGLETEATLRVAKLYESEFVAQLKPIYDKYNLDKLTKKQRSGLLEACIHGMEKSRKLVG